MPQEVTAKAIRLIRKANKLSQKELAEILTCSVESVSLYERGIVAIPNIKRKKLLQYFGLSPKDFDDNGNIVDKCLNNVTNNNINSNHSINNILAEKDKRIAELTHQIATLEKIILNFNQK